MSTTAYRIKVDCLVGDGFGGTEYEGNYLAFSSKKDALASFRSLKKEHRMTYEQWRAKDDDDDVVHTTLTLTKYVLIEPKKKLILQLLEQRWFAQKVEKLAEWDNEADHQKRYRTEMKEETEKSRKFVQYCEENLEGGLNQPLPKPNP